MQRDIQLYLRWSISCSHFLPCCYKLFTLRHLWNCKYGERSCWVDEEFTYLLNPYCFAKWYLVYITLFHRWICDVFQVTNFPDLALIKRYLSISNRRPLNLWLQSCYRKCFWIFVTTFGNFLLHLLKTALYIFTNLTCCNMY